MSDKNYIKIIKDPYSHHPLREYGNHNMYFLTNLVFEVVSPTPTLEEIVSYLDASVSKQMCYLVTRDNFLRMCPQLENMPKTKTVAIPEEFATLWHPEGLINPITGKGMGLEEGVRKSKRWVEEARKLGISDNPFTLRR